MGDSEVFYSQTLTKAPIHLMVLSLWHVICIIIHINQIYNNSINYEFFKYSTKQIYN